MVIEMLTFEVDPSERAQWLEVEERTWSRFLEQQRGFVRKEMWVDRESPGLVHAVIWWTDQESWFSIPKDELGVVDASMGTWYRDCTLRILDVIREC